MVALPDLLVLAPGIAPVPIEDECNVLRYGACGEDGDEGVAGLGVDLGAEPAEGRGDELESHVVGNGLASRRVSSSFLNDSGMWISHGQKLEFLVEKAQRYRKNLSGKKACLAYIRISVSDSGMCSRNVT